MTTKIKTLSELLDYTIATVWAGKKSETHLASNGRDVLRTLGNIPIKSINGGTVEALRFALKRDGWTAATVNRKLAALSKMLNVAADLELINRVPRIRRERESEPRSAVLGNADQHKLLDAMRLVAGHHEADLIEFLLLTGLRVGEALALRGEDLDRTTRSIRVANTKANRPRTVPLPERALELWDRQICVEVPWAGIQYQALWGEFRAACKFAGLANQNLVLHSLRHTYASRLVKAGVNLRAVQKLLGHSSITVTQRYAHLDLEDLTNAVAKLNTA